MRFIALCFLLFTALVSCQAQSGSPTLLDEVKTKLTARTATVSAILTDNKYASLHPETAFRDLIGTHAGTGILTIAENAEPGKKIRVLGTIVNKDGSPVANALVYLYQTDSRGWYAAGSPHVGGNEGDMRHARIFGYVRTNDKGQFELHTIKPSGYPQSDLPAHIHVHVWAEGYRNYINEFLFDDDDRLVGTIREQAIRNRFQINKPEKAGAGFDQQFSYTIQLNKN